jgi:hypothetical protein
MPLKMSSRVVKNRAAFDPDNGALVLALADGLLKAGEEIRADAYAHAPFDPEHEAHSVAHGRGRGQSYEASLKGGPKDPHLRDTDHVGVWVNGRKVGGGANKPKSLRMPKGQVVMAVGFGDPLAHLYELGTIRPGSHRPFLLPAFDRGIPGTSKYIAPAIAARLRAIP